MNDMTNIPSEIKGKEGDENDQYDDIVQEHRPLDQRLMKKQIDDPLKTVSRTNETLAATAQTALGENVALINFHSKIPITEVLITKLSKNRVFDEDTNKTNKGFVTDEDADKKIRAL